SSYGDWSSDVCSSDLLHGVCCRPTLERQPPCRIELAAMATPVSDPGSGNRAAHDRLRRPIDPASTNKRPARPLASLYVAGPFSIDRKSVVSGKGVELV